MTLIETMARAAQLETANNMPSMTAETDRIEKAKSKLSAEERRLLGVRG